MVALLLGMVRIGNKSLWFDEAISAEFAHRSLRRLVPVITGGDPNMALYYVLLNLWRRLFGGSELALRSFSAVAGAAAVVAIYVLGTRLLGRRGGVIAALFLALNPFMLEYAQTARGYTLVACLVTVSCWLFVIELERPTLAARVGFVVVSALAVYAHYFAALVLLAQLGTLVVLRRRFAITPTRLTMVVGVVALCLPAVVFARAGGTGRIDWIPPLTLWGVLTVVVKHAGRSVVLVAAFGAATAWATRRLLLVRGASSAFAQQEWRVGFLLAWLVVPFAVALLVSLRRPLFLAQYLIVCVPALCLLTAAWLSALEPRRWSTPLLVLLLVLPLVRVYTIYRYPGDERWRALEAYVAPQLRDGDRVVFYPKWAGVPYDYYARRRWDAQPVQPRLTDSDSARRLWLVVRDPDANRLRADFILARTALANDRIGARRIAFGDVSVELLERVP
ncbi:MAG: glycosyltransferase family 39 protein [Gemmatimonadaceae bacterium]